MMHTQEIDAEQARLNMLSTTGGIEETIRSLNDAIQSASEAHRGHTVAFLARDNVSIESLERIVAHFKQRGFQVDDRCHDRESFVIIIRWYPD